MPQEVLFHLYQELFDLSCNGKIELKIEGEEGNMSGTLKLEDGRYSESIESEDLFDCLDELISRIRQA